MVRFYLCLLWMGFSTTLFSQEKEVLYLIPGQGSDERIFKNMEFPEQYELVHIAYQTPEEDWDMHDFAVALAKQIDTTREFSILGVSLGGMLATEMSTFLSPKQVILLSSAKSAEELPRRYRLQKKLKLYKWIGPKLAQQSALFLQPIVEPDRNKEKETCVNMLKKKDPVFLQRTIHMIIEWDRVEVPTGITHVHGDNDHTIPSRNVALDYCIKKGSHMMTLTRAEELSALLADILKANVE